MRPLRTFTIEPSLPPQLASLIDIAYNLRWSWNGQAMELFHRLDPERWETTSHNPVKMLGQIGQGALERAAKDEGYLAQVERVYNDLQDYTTTPGWWPRTHGSGDANEPLVAYFCAEYGLTDCLPIYAGGLGILAGDHLKSASELDIPLVAVGLLYQQGYFHQRLNADGWQLEMFPRNDFHTMPIRPLANENGDPLTIDVDIQDRHCKVRIWLAQVGRIRLFLLDTNVPENTSEDRHITGQLYGGDQEMRIRQEIVLGIGGTRALSALGIKPKAFHMNEGHSAFLSLERIRMLMVEHGVSLDEARQAVSASSVFTTHTPVPAGNDAFSVELVEKYFNHYWPQLGLDRDAFMDLGRQDVGDEEGTLAMTVLALRMTASRNGVSELHGQVSRHLWETAWPGVPQEEVPIGHVTNGIHTLSWISHDLAGLYDRYLGPRWHEKPSESGIWEAADSIPDTELWRTHERRRERLVAFARDRLKLQLRRRGASSAEIAGAEEILDPEALTIGFARRFATYKRAGLILADMDRLKRLIDNQEQRVQFIFAGKAHPMDNPGKDLIRKIIHTVRQSPYRHSMVFLEDYDMNVARYLVQGVDVWLNTPLRPMEASGTSGMKVAANGGLNLSILDGWWAEGFTPENGWSIGQGETYDDLDYQNEVESEALYDLLEKEIIPLFYNRGNDHIPRGWLEKMKATIRQLAPVYNTNRMVSQYAETYYAPASKRWESLTADGLAKARELTGWLSHMQSNFHDVHIQSVHDNMDERGVTVGQNVSIDATIALNHLAPDDICVQLYFGPLDIEGQLEHGQIVEMERSETLEGNRVRYVASLPCDASGMVGYTLRILPANPLLADPLSLSLLKWA
jgi:glycogen phosphorylase